MCKITVIIPTYKPGEYIFDCLKSIYTQSLSHHNYEIIIVLNGPKEPFYSALVKYKSENTYIYYTEQSGVSNARNIGIEKAKGEYICFIDDDDVISYSYLEGLLLTANKTTLAISNIYSFINNIDEKRDNFFVCKKIRNKESINTYSHYQCRSFLAFPVAKLIHREIIGNHRYDCRFKNGEDSLFMTSISDKITSIKFTSDDAIYYVRERIGSASRQKIPFKRLIIDSFKLITTYIKLYFKAPKSYNFLLFLSRIPGVIKNAYCLSLNK